MMGLYAIPFEYCGKLEGIAKFENSVFIAHVHSTSLDVIIKAAGLMGF